MRNKFIVAAGIGLGLLFCLTAQPSTGLSILLNQGYNALDDWKYQDAEEAAAKVEEMMGAETDKDQQADAYYFLAQYWFHRADYRRSLAELDKSLELKTGSQSKEKKFHDRLEKLAELFAHPGEASSDHFLMRWTDPRDELLAQPGLAALEQAYAALSQDFDFTPKGGKILVEIYPNAAELANGVGLEEKMIKDSGTIAVCKYRRLMLTSPRALAFGYDYLVTFSHELVHFFVYSRAGESIPVWFHEGLAKYEEMSFRGQAGELSPVPKSLLVTAIKNNELISFRQMSPTFAQFKTPKQGQLAFSEVATMVDYLRRNCGRDSWFKMFDLLGQGKTDKEAMGMVCGQDFNSIWQNWQKWVLAKNWPAIPGAVVMRLEFKEQEGLEEAEEKPEAGEDKTGEYVRLGDLLRDRKFYQAAVVEYKKALNLEPYDPRVMNKLGLGQALAGNYPDAISILKQSAEIYPNYSTTYIYLGQAYWSSGDTKNAVSSYETGLEQNPFNPIPYRNLIQLYQKQGDSARASELQKNLEILKKPGR